MARQTILRSIFMAVITAHFEWCFGQNAEQLRPVFKQERVLAAAQEGDGQRYLAFPAIADLGDRVLVSFKRGRSHANDSGAGLELLTIGGQQEPVLRGTIARLDEAIMQMGQWIVFPNGDIANYIDAQQAPGAKRIGLRAVRSTDGGKSFGTLNRVGAIGGVEYGYAFDWITRGSSTWMLAMRFSNLQGGASVSAARPHAGSVDVLVSNDNGESWQLVRNLTEEFGNIAINESTFAAFDDGFVICTRGYDGRQRLHRTDSAFKLLRQIDLTERYPFIEREIGRPRLFLRDNSIYLLGRNWTASTEPMKLCLFRIDPKTLDITAYCILDNLSNQKVTDGYYAQGYFRQAAARTLFNVVTYKALNGQPPAIIELSFDWSELR